MGDVGSSPRKAAEDRLLQSQVKKSLLLIPPAPKKEEKGEKEGDNFLCYTAPF